MTRKYGQNERQETPVKQRFYHYSLGIGQTVRPRMVVMPVNRRSRPALPHQECYRRTDRQDCDGDTESDGVADGRTDQHASSRRRW